uniref:Zinc finger protein 883-like n=1 Tax=Leptobrachium leishanense TaxID=445787 RepID=A0A8C5WDX8_9ANUR
MDPHTARDLLSQRILDLTLEMIFLLTGEGHMVVKIHEMVSDSSRHQISEGHGRSQSFNTEPPPHSGIQNHEKILELSNQIIRLLTGEVPIRCEDVTVYLSMEEWEYVERHKELYEDLMMEDHRPLRAAGEAVPDRIHTWSSDVIHGIINKPKILEKCLSSIKPSDLPAEHVTGASEEAPSLHQENVTEYPRIEPRFTHIKEEPTSWVEGNVCDSNTRPLLEHPPRPSGPIKEEAAVCDGNLTHGETHRAVNSHRVTPDTSPCDADKSSNCKSPQSTPKPEPMFTCSERQTCFTGNSEPHKHQTRHTEGMPGPSNTVTPGGGPLSCGENCDYVSQLHKKAKIHIKGNPTSCPECGERFTEETSLVEHHKIHTEASGGNLLACNDCGKCFAQASDLGTHREVHTREKPYKCNECRKCFARASYLSAHRKVHTGDKPYKCNECRKCFAKGSVLEIHKRSHTGEKPYKCSVCDKCFTQASVLTVHKRTHIGAKPYKCNECGKCFANSSNLNAHTKIHTGYKPYKCDECRRCFSRASDFKIHKRTHTGERPYVCNDCGKCFTDNSSLKVHRRIHTGEKKYKCEECGKYFTHASSLTTHKRTHTGEKPYECTECGKCFSDGSSHSVHKRIHTGEKSYKCEECGKFFAHSSGLKMHIRTHTGEKPYECNECGKWFSEASTLNAHRRTHTGDKPYKCSECGKCFARASGLNIHKRTHTGEKP